jgi:hypothetical protein
MSRILTTNDGRWYDQLKAVAYYGETELEKWIQQHASSLFPHHYVIPFKKDINSPKMGTKRPDLALIRKDLSGWVVVEVELEGHKLDHVLGQTKVFLDGDYNLPEIATYVRDQLSRHHNKQLTLNQLKVMLDSHAPSVLVIADEHAEDWQDELKKLGIQLCVFEIYKSTTGLHVYRVFGDYPTVFAEDAHCRPHASLPNLVEVIGNFTFTGVAPTGLVEVIFEECLTQWSLFEEKGRKYLRFLGKSNPVPLSPRETYRLYRDKSDKYYFKRN